MKKLLFISALSLGLVSTSVYADCYSDSFDVTVNKKPLKCNGTQRVYLAGGAIQGWLTAVCSEENTSSPAVRTAKWVASFYEGTTGTSSSYGKNCYLHQSGGMSKWNCRKWIKRVKVSVNPHNCLDFDEAYDYAIAEQ